MVEMVIWSLVLMLWLLVLVGVWWGCYLFRGVRGRENREIFSGGRILCMRVLSLIPIFNIFVLLYMFFVLYADGE